MRKKGEPEGGRGRGGELKESETHFQASAVRPSVRRKGGREGGREKEIGKAANGTVRRKRERD